MVAYVGEINGNKKKTRLDIPRGNPVVRAYHTRCCLLEIVNDIPQANQLPAYCTGLALTSTAFCKSD